MPSVHLLVSSHPAMFFLILYICDPCYLCTCGGFHYLWVPPSCRILWYLSRLFLFKFCYSFMVVEVTLPFFRDLGHFHLTGAALLCSIRLEICETLSLLFCTGMMF